MEVLEKIKELYYLLGTKIINSFLISFYYMFSMQLVNAVSSFIA